MENIRHLVEDSATSIMGGIRFRQDRVLGSHNPDLYIEDENVDPAEVVLPEYDVQVKSRTTHANAETDEYGTYRQEKVRYTDGAVRLVTIAQPKNPMSNHAVVSADPWLTGSKGFNRLEIQQLVQCGFNVVWNHHHGRHAALPTNKDRLTTMLHFLSSKSIGKSAAHDHALLDDLSKTVDFDTDQTYRKGYSRSAMSGEAYIALGARRDNKRETLWSDLEAHCFARSVSAAGLAKILAKQAPHEGAAVGNIVQSMLKKVPINNTDRTVSPSEYFSTVDMHPLNIAHELAWIGLFIGGEAGLFGKAVPLDAKGVRTVYEHDYMSQSANQKAMHAEREGIVLLERPGAHLTGGSPEMLAEKFERYRRLAWYAFEHSDDMSDLTAADVLPSQKQSSVA